MLCNDCPRNCNVDRQTKLGFCHEGAKIRVSKIIENFMWEEPCISGEKGALAIFFSGCNLRCSFCQNYELSHVGKGQEYSPEEFFELLKRFDLENFSSIDLITPSHFSSLLSLTFENFSSPIPIVWNSSGYEKVEIIEKVSSFVDVFLPDIKYFSSTLSAELSKAEDYFAVSSKAIKKMRELKSENIFLKNGVLQKGVLIRHLVLPNNAKDSFECLNFIKREIPCPFVSIMSQFTPHGENSLFRKIYPLEYKSVLAHADKLGLHDGFRQDFDSADENFIPEF